MKRTKHIEFAATLLLATVTIQLSAFAQGTLTPPGAPAPTMKTLQEVEPRTPIVSTPFTITTPGSYYLTTNLIVNAGNGIDIQTNGVTVDLNGFSLICTSSPAGFDAIILSGPLRDITILNGHILGGVTNNGSGVYSGSGFANGINNNGYVTDNVRVSGVSVAGCQLVGIFLITNNSTVVESCTVRTVGSYGIFATTIKNCVALDCSQAAIWGEQVSDCRGYSTHNIGVRALSALNCYGSSSGIYAGVHASTAQNCYGYSTDSYGIEADTAENCYGRSVGGVGVYATTAHNCNGYSGSSYGIQVTASAIGCYAESATGDAALLSGNAAFCTASRSGGRAIWSSVATGCFALAGTNLITFKYNMP